MNKKLTFADLATVNRKLPGGRVEVRFIDLRERKRKTGGSWVEYRFYTDRLLAKELPAVLDKRNTQETARLIARWNEQADEKDAQYKSTAAKQTAYIATLPKAVRDLIGKRIVVAGFLRVEFSVSWGDDPKLECSCGPDACLIDVEVAEQLVEQLKGTAVHVEDCK